MKISKTTLNFALTRNMDITNNFIENFQNSIWIWSDNNDCEPICIYGVNSDETLSFVSCFDKNIQEELPAQIKSEKFLRTVIDYVSKNTGNQNG